jgi:hypothetical protein
MIATWKRYAGMTVAPAAWAITTQLGQTLPYKDCNSRMSWSLAAAAAGAGLALASALISYREYKQTTDRTALFVDDLSVGIGMVFTFALGLQVAATLVLNACER